MFRNINKKRTIKKAIQNLKQKGVAIAYTTKF
jgi:biotin operon repressor